MRRAYVALVKASAVLGLAVFLVVPNARSEEARLSISGYDPVAYFTDGKPVSGVSEFEHVWHGARWRFVSAAHRDLFIANPERYAPQYDGYCAMGVAGMAIAAAHKDTADPEAWAIVDGKLYLTHTKRTMEERWRPSMATNIKRADQNWPSVAGQVEPSIVGAPCRDHPPSVIVSTDGGGRRLMVGSQAAVDEHGALIGRDDMRSQIEQVGKNIQACLAAAGAKVPDILLTRAYVVDEAAFKKNGDMRLRYLGPESPNSTTTVVPRLPAGPGFLVEIEAVASLN